MINETINYSILQAQLLLIPHLLYKCVYDTDLSHQLSLRKHAYFKCTENFTSKNWKLSDKNYDIFPVSAQNIDCGYSLEPPRRGGSNEYPQSMFWAEIGKIMYTPVKPSFTI